MNNGTLTAQVVVKTMQFDTASQSKIRYIGVSICFWFLSNFFFVGVNSFF